MRRLATLLLLTGWLAACGGGGEDPTADSDVVTNRFDADRAFADLEAQVAIGPRPSGSPEALETAELIASRLEEAGVEGIEIQRPLANVVGSIPGDTRKVVVVGAHFDTEDAPGFVGANDGASATAVVLELARALRPRQLRPTLVFAFFDGEESPAGTPDEEFERYGLRGSRVAARRYARADAMVLLDFVGDRDLSIPREDGSDRRLWSKLRASARAVGAGRFFPPGAYPEVIDDHVPFQERGVPAIDLIDFDFRCFHETCDDLSAVSERSLDAVGESMVELLPRL